MGFMSFFRSFVENYNVESVFGCRERIPSACPTFIERDVHRQFVNYLRSYNLIIVYGESRQGKTWMVDRYCPKQLRIGCTGDMDVSDLKKAMLNSMGVKIRDVTVSVTTGSNSSAGSSIKASLGVSAGIESEITEKEERTVTTAYMSVDVGNLNEFISALKSYSKDSVFVFDNFHYLDPKVQLDFCSLIKELNYHDIKIVIIGVWKDAARVTALAPDLINRCAHLDVGSWNTEELSRISHQGERALNISIGPVIVKEIVRCCARNVGIYMDILQKYCQNSNIVSTRHFHVLLSDEKLAKKTIRDVVAESFKPLHDRILNLALPQRENSKRIRLRIVIGLLTFMYHNRVNKKKVPNRITSIKIRDLQDSMANVEKQP